MARIIAIGEQNFSEIIENNYFYIDKTGFIKEWWENGDTVTLITRPRRFGKTLAMNMLYDFFSVSRKGRSDLFENLNIWKEEKYRRLQGDYPVIFLSFAAVKAGSFEKTYADISKLIARVYRQYAFLMEDSCFLETDREQFNRIMNGKADDSEISSSINQLSEYLFQYYGKKALIILDEYDTPLQEAYVNGYWDELADFIRRFFNASFKTNAWLKRGIMTGITRISRESVFSELNNLAVITVTSRKYADSFGFTEKEVSKALQEYGLESQKDEVKRWYDGFRFGECGSIYNPWSITQFLDEKVFAAYWANTSSNRLAGKLIQQGSREMKTIMEDLLEGKSFYAAIDEQTSFGELNDSQDAVWSLFLASGYLKADGCQQDRKPGLLRGEKQYRLMLTNLEMVYVFRKLIRGWFAACSSSYNAFIRALLSGDLESMNGYINQVASATFSSFDSGVKASGKGEPERFYHGFVLGLIVDLSDRYEITSNRESGFARYDVLLKPRSGREDAIILEFKAIQPEKEKSLEHAAESAIRQILDKNYAEILKPACSRNQTGEIRIYGFAFRGKEVLIEGRYLHDYES